MNISRNEFIIRSSTAMASIGLAPLFAFAQRFSADKKIRIGIIGCGSVSNMYLPHLSKSPHVELISVCDIRYERAQQQALKFKIPNHYPSPFEPIAHFGYWIFMISIGFILPARHEE